MQDQLPFSETIANAPQAEDRPGMVRLGKDFMHVGSFLMGFREDGSQVLREFTEADFSAYVARFYELKAAGIPTPLRWGHGDGIHDTDDTQSIADIADVWADNGKLFFTVYVSPETAAKLKEKQRPCSPGLEPNFVDGTGKVWPGYSLKHIAIVSHATTPNQLPFIQMGLPAPQPKKEKKMPVTFEPLVAGINRLIDRVSPGKGLPVEGDNAVTEENFDTIFPIVIDAIIGAEQEEEEAPEEEAPVVEESGEADPLLMSLKSAVETLMVEVKSLKGSKADEAKAGFESAVDALCEAGTIKAAQKPILMELAKPKGYDLKLLSDLYDGAEPVILMGSKTKHLRTAREPETTGVTESDKARARKLRGLKEKKAG